MTRGIYDPICEGVKREPLPYEHSPFTLASGGASCQYPEGDLAGTSSDCPGCLVRSAVECVVNPTRTVEMPGKRRTTILAAFRENVDEFDPIRVTVERELARRGIQ